MHACTHHACKGSRNDKKQIIELPITRKAMQYSLTYTLLISSNTPGGNWDAADAGVTPRQSRAVTPKDGAGVADGGLHKDVVSLSEQPLPAGQSLSDLLVQCCLHNKCCESHSTTIITVTIRVSIILMAIISKTHAS